jgi:lipopolysaccharide biosynthesis regulator YciM
MEDQNIADKRLAVKTAPDTNTAVGLLLEIGDLWKEKPNNIEAEKAYTEALELLPDHRLTLNQLIILYNETKQWPKAIEIIERLAGLEEDPKRRARFNYTIAVILRDEMKQADQALDFFNKTLDDDCEYLKAFEKIDQILTQRKDWKNLERNYRKMLKRIVSGQKKELQIMLWHGLGEIYRTRLINLSAAAEAFEAACRLEPTNPTRHETLASLYEADPNQWKKAVEHHNKLLDLKYDRVESFQSLYRIYMQSQQYDKAFCMAAALRFMYRASPEEQSFHEQYRQRGLVVAKRIIDDEAWRNQVADKNENQYISAIFRLISRYVAQIYAVEEKDKGFKKKDRVDFTQTKLNFTQRFQQVNQIMKVAVPLLYIQPTRPGFDYECLIVDKQFMPAVVAGGDLLSDKSDKEIVFLLAKNLTYMRPEYFLIRALKMNQATIKVILRSALVMVAPKLAVPPAEQGAVTQFVQKFISIIPQPIISQVKTVVERAISEGNDFSTTSWMQSVELAANRAGLLLCNDLEVAARMVQTDPTPLSPLTVKDKLKDLIRYAISEEYFQLRSSLGITIDGNPEPASQHYAEDTPAPTPKPYIEDVPELTSMPYRDAPPSAESLLLIELKQSLAALSLEESVAPALLALPLCELVWANKDSHSKESEIVSDYINKNFTFGSEASTQAHKWLKACPNPEYCEKARILLNKMVKASYHPLTTKDQLKEMMRLANEISAAAGGFLGIGKVSKEEKAILAKLEAAFKLD